MPLLVFTKVIIMDYETNYTTISYTTKVFTFTCRLHDFLGNSNLNQYCRLKKSQNIRHCIIQHQVSPISSGREVINKMQWFTRKEPIRDYNEIEITAGLQRESRMLTQPAHYLFDPFEPLWISLCFSSVFFFLISHGFLCLHLQYYTR